MHYAYISSEAMAIQKWAFGFVCKVTGTNVCQCVKDCFFGNFLNNNIYTVLYMRYKKILGSSQNV